MYNIHFWFGHSWIITGKSEPFFVSGEAREEETGQYPNIKEELVDHNFNPGTSLYTWIRFTKQQNKQIFLICQFLYCGFS